MGRKRKEKFVRKEKPALVAQTARQGLLIGAIKEKDLTVTTGFAGTGKTYIPAHLAADSYDRGTAWGGHDKLILTRPNVASGEKLGYRPGDLHEKLLEWFAEPLGIIRERIGAGALEVGLKKETIQLVPFESMRGRSFNDAFVMLDEAQNITPHEMRMFVTRLGKNTTTVINGDIRQSDLKGSRGLPIKSGLAELLEIINTFDMDVPVIDFQEDDIVRSDLCKQFIVNWMKYDAIQAGSN